MKLFVLILASSFISFNAALTGKIFTPKMNFTSNPLNPNSIESNLCLKLAGGADGAVGGEGDVALHRAVVVLQLERGRGRRLQVRPGDDSIYPTGSA